VLVIDELSKRYGRRLVLDSVSAEVPDGQITALLGPNGAGKSTMLHAIVGLLVPDHGGVSVVRADGSLGGAGEIGFCPDDLPMAELLTGNEYLELVKGVRRVHVRTVVQRSLLRGMRLDSARNALIGTYSHGMRRKLQLIAALLHAPSALVLDEPLRGLDPESASIMKHLLRRYADRGGAVLLSTHDLLAAEQLCDRVLVLDDGSLRAETDLDALRSGGSDGSLESGFLAVTGLANEVGHAADDFFAGLDALVADSRA
jgi:ABC-2 type transport system ATP-binding protein